MLDTPNKIKYAEPVRLARRANVLQKWMLEHMTGCGLNQANLFEYKYLVPIIYL